MSIFIAIYVTLLGLMLGSFYNVVALRVPAGESIIHPPSRCSSCGTRLRARDLIPVFSYLFSGGRCRNCSAKLSALYPLGEAATGLLFLWVYLRTGLAGESLVGLALVSLGVIVTISDLKYMRIPNKVLLFFAPLLILLRILVPEYSLWSHMLGALAGGGIILLIIVISGGGMGMGDAKLLALCGLVIGLPNTLLALFIACVLGTLVGGVLMLAGILQRRQPIPFGPWLIIGIFVAYGYGSQIISGYFSLIG
ncbi:A24 family peptidase [Paenibacillus sp. YPG26]|uniref:prepilin peptidase n=1 Tax=Paenibacillus sp. YPG26 TaxID=2878915 RepID=UPI0020412F6E|nr:A24 family peptidase [Paenibacillus sp. YPG26]USB33684.1 prepilin peptidase [Paenibacillus sp. YPG26]